MSVLIVFGKCFCFENFQKFQKTVQLYFGDSTSQVKPIASPQSRAYTEAFGDSLASQGPSCEKDLEIFQNFGFLGSSQLSLATCSRVEAPVASLTQNGS